MLTRQIGFGSSVLASVCPFVTFFDACHILWTKHARVLKFHIWIHHGKIAEQVFFLVWVISLFGVMPLQKKIRMKSCQQGIWKSIWARGWKLGQLIEDDEYITWLTFERILYFSRVIALWKFQHFKLVSKISQKLFELGAWNLVSW